MCLSEVEDRMVEINEPERKKEKQIKRNEDNLRDLWDNVKSPNIRINSRITEAKEWVSHLEHNTMDITATKQNKEEKQMKISLKPLGQH